ncbi:unnamed protein product [Clonostachys solani]|uniref:Uncharacterized protein n=1 Tax=Clonostachys solani TaxID=160281 RepID=A0A9N9YZ83_9HYPO|nr:unnamed protein product [Clonostachys solani]
MGGRAQSVQRAQTDNCLLPSPWYGYLTTDQSVGSSGPTDAPKETSWRRQMDQTRPLKLDHGALTPIAIAIASYSLPSIFPPALNAIPRS